MVGLRIVWPSQFVECGKDASASRNLSHPTFAKLALTCGGAFPTFRTLRSPGAQDGRCGEEKLDASNGGDFWPVRRLRGDNWSEAWAIRLFVKVKNMEVRYPGRHDVTLRYPSFDLGYDMKPIGNAECGMRTFGRLRPGN